MCMKKKREKRIKPWNCVTSAYLIQNSSKYLELFRHFTKIDGRLKLLLEIAKNRSPNLFVKRLKNVQQISYIIWFLKLLMYLDMYLLLWFHFGTWGRYISSFSCFKESLVVFMKTFKLITYVWYTSCLDNFRFYRSLSLIHDFDMFVYF